MKKNKLIQIALIFLLLPGIGCDKEEPVDTKQIVYPDHGIYGLNLLDTSLTEYQHGAVSLCASLGEDATLKVRVAGEKWTMTSSTLNQWNASGYNENDHSRMFTSIQSGTIDGRLGIYPDKPVEITVYENGSEWATWSKTINIE